MRKIIGVILTVAMLVFVCCSCGEKKNDSVSVENSEYYSKFKDAGISINVYNWGEYIPDGSDESPDINAEFTELTGIEVNYTTYATNEELYAKLKAGAANYDIIIPSDYMISRMIQEGMLEKLNYDNIPNYQNIMEKFKRPEYDETAEYTVPYTWGTVGIIFNTDMVDIPKEDIDWDTLWNPEYKDNILMFDNPRDAFAIAQKLLGYSLNTESRAELKASADKLKEQKPLVQAYVMDEIFDKMGAGEAAFAPYYAGDALTMMGDYDNLDFVMPKGGVNLFVDAICIPKGAQNKEAAEMYINFMCEPEVALAVADYIGYSTPNEKAYDMLDDEIKNNGISYPADEFLENNTEVFRNLSNETNKYMQDLWTEIKADK